MFFYATLHGSKYRSCFYRLWFYNIYIKLGTDLSEIEENDDKVI